LALAGESVLAMQVKNTVIQPEHVIVNARREQARSYRTDPN
jgi:hypothetical protein